MARRGKNSGVMKWGFIGGAIASGAALIPMIPALKRRAMRATTILKKDHRMVSGMIMTLELTPRFNGMVRTPLFDQIRNSLMVHAQVEEEIFYPAIRNVMLGSDSAKVDEAYSEHQYVKDLLNEMTGLDATSEEFDQKLAELKESINHHVKEEENEMFPRVHDRMTTESLEDLGQRMHDRKMDLKTKIAA